MPVSRWWPLRGVLAVVLAIPVLGSTTAPVGAEETGYETVFAFTDREITESSGLVDRDPLMFTVNDSGDDPVVYAVDKTNGDTVAVTTYSSSPVSDVEAIAPGPGDAVWVGDIGDNNEERSSVSVYKVVPLGSPEQQPDALDGQGQEIEENVAAEKFSLVYPDSAHNAEALLVHPDTGRLYVVTKGITGGTVFAAPERLDPDSANRLEDIGQVPGLITDGSFLPGGGHIMLRLYGRAAVYTFPDLRLVGSMGLPPQEQGEGLAIGRGGKIYISTEGAYSEVLRILLPEAVSKALANPALETTLPSPSRTPPQTPASDALSTGDGAGLWVAAGALVLTVAGWLSVTVARRRRKRIP